MGQLTGAHTPPLKGATNPTSVGMTLSLSHTLSPRDGSESACVHPIVFEEPGREFEIWVEVVCSL